MLALCLRFIGKLRNRVTGRLEKGVGSKNKSVGVQCVTVDELTKAENLLISLTQQQNFPVEIDALRKLCGKDLSNRTVARERNIILKRTSNVYRLDLYLDSAGLMRVGGRIRRSSLPRDIAHPILLPRNSYVTDLIIAYYHGKSGHSGRGITLNAIRSNGFWIIHSMSKISSYIWSCVVCRKLRGSTIGQKMTDLSGDRLEPAPPFTYSGVDCFGPFYVRESRSDKKRWGVLFTCLVSWAIHIEVASSLSTDSFLNAYRRFVCRRGPVRILRSDQGTNFMGAKSQQAAALAELDKDKIQRELLKDSCDFVDYRMNVPHVSHMGGVWERMIRCARNALSALLTVHGGQLDDECLHTLLVEAEAIVNSRPLTVVDGQSPDSGTPISPMQLLTLKSNVVMSPPGVLSHRISIFIGAGVVYSTWQTNFGVSGGLSFFQRYRNAKKWVRSSRDTHVGDIVLMVDDSLSRNQWPLARVTKIFKDKDGFVCTVNVTTGQSSYDRPVHKLVLLVECTNDTT